MAFWLDPLNNFWPAGMDSESARKAAAIHLNFPKPVGVSRVFSPRGISGLLVDATDEGFALLREIVAVLDVPERRVALRARVVSIPIAEMTRFWADLSTLSNQNPPTAILVNQAEENALADQIAREKAHIEAIRNAVSSEGAPQSLDFGPRTRPNSSRDGVFSDSFVIPPPLGFDEQFSILLNPSRTPPAPAPFDALRLQITPTFGKEAGALSLKILESSGLTGKPTLFFAALKSGETWALALPRAAPGERAFLLLTASLTPRISPRGGAPLPGDLPGIGGLFEFRAPATPQNATPQNATPQKTP